MFFSADEFKSLAAKALSWSQWLTRSLGDCMVLHCRGEDRKPKIRIICTLVRITEM